VRVEAARFHVVLVGCGGTGSYVFYYLSRLMFTELQKEFGKRTTVVLVDGDTVEPKNLYRQNFIESDVGLNKAYVLARRYSTAYGIHVEYYDRYADVDCLERLLQYTYRPYLGIVVPILVGCVDNHVARRALHETFEGFRGPLIYIDAGNGEATGQVVIGVKGKVEKEIFCSQVSEVFAEPAGKILPNLLEPEDEEEESGLSCADLSLRDGQSIMANFATATLVNVALNSIINHHKIPFHMAATDILTGKTKTVPIRRLKKS